MEPIVYLPVEIRHRELPARILLASHLLQAGYAIMIGNHWALTAAANRAALPPGLFLFKSVNKLQGNLMASLWSDGHRVAASDEEVLVFTEDHGYTVAFADVAAFACSLFFAQSDAHRDAIARRFPNLNGKISVVGNPRLDLLSAGNRALIEPDDRVPALRPYILFNTNYGSANSVWGERALEIAASTGAFDGPDRATKVAEYEAVVNWERANYFAMVALMQWTLANIPNMNVVVRPHPSERPELWEAVLAGCPRAHLIPRSDPHSWILGAELVIHTGCTTGLEALLLDRPVLNLLPKNHPNCEQIVTEANPTVRSWEDAAAAIRMFLVEGKGPIVDHGPPAQAALEKHLPTCRTNAAAGLMARGLVDELQRRGAHPRKNFAVNWRGPFRAPKRTAIQMDKYSATVVEVGAGLDKAIAGAGLSVTAELTTVCEGLFLAVPR